MHIRWNQLMERVEFKKGDKLGASEGVPTTSLFVVVRGRVERRRAGHVVDESAQGMGDLPEVSLLGTLHTACSVLRSNSLLPVLARSSTSIVVSASPYF